MLIAVKNVVTGAEAYVPDHYIDHPILGADLVRLEDAEATPKEKTKSKEQPAPEETITEEQV